jgi:hypothetical protein
MGSEQAPVYPPRGISVGFVRPQVAGYDRGAVIGLLSLFAGVHIEPATSRQEEQSLRRPVDRAVRPLIRFLFVADEQLRALHAVRGGLSASETSIMDDQCTLHTTPSASLHHHGVPASPILAPSIKRLSLSAILLTVDSQFRGLSSRSMGP